MADLRVNVTADVSKAKKDLKGLENDIKRMKSTASKPVGGKGGMSAFGGRRGQGSAKSMAGDMITDVLSERFGDFGGKFGKLGNLGKLGNIGGRLGGVVSKAGPYAAAAYAGYKLLRAPADFAQARAAKGRSYYDSFNNVNANLSQIQKNLGGDGYVQGLTQALVELGTKGKVPLEQLQQTAARLMLAFGGNQQKTEKFVRIVADIAAATGHSTDEMSDLIARVNALGKAEESMINQLNEKGIPIYKALADELGVSVEKAKELAKQGKISADEFNRALEAAHKASVSGANESSVVKNAAYYEKQLAELNAKINAIHYTSKMDAVATEAAKRKYEQERAYYEDDPAVENMHEALGDIGATFQRLFDDFGAEFREIMNGFLTGLAQIADFALKFTDYHEDRADSAALNSRTAVKAANDATKSGGWANRVEMLAAQGSTVEDAAAALMNGGHDVGATKLSQDIAQSKSRIKDNEWALKQRYVDDERKEIARKELEAERQLLADLEAAQKLREDRVKVEVERLKAEKLAGELQIQQLEKEGDYIKSWNKTHKINGEDEWTGIVKSESEVLTKYQKALEEIRSGRGTEAMAAFVKYFEPMAKDIEKKQKEAEANAAARETFTLERKAKSDAGAAFMLDYQRTAEQMRKIGFSEEDITKEGGFMHAAAKSEYEKKIEELGTQTASLEDRAHKLGYSDYMLSMNRLANGTYTGSKEDFMKLIPSDQRDNLGKVYDNLRSYGFSHQDSLRTAANCTLNLQQKPGEGDIMMTSYERGAWGQGLALETVDPTVEELREQRKELEAQLKKQDELLQTAKDQLEAIKKIDVRAKAL